MCTIYILNSDSYTFFFNTKEELVNSKCRMLFRKFCPEKLDKSRPLMRMPMQTIYEKEFMIPELKILSTDDCAFCLDKVENDKIVLHCKHIFHLKCLWKHLETKNLLSPKSDTCIRFKCEHGDKIKSFFCPTCNKITNC